jgi:hypothetical protein
MTVFGASGEANTFDYQAGDVGYIPFPMGHYIQNTGTDTLRFLEMFRSDRYADVSLDQWLALTPPGARTRPPPHRRSDDRRAREAQGDRRRPAVTTSRRRVCPSLGCAAAPAVRLRACT